MLGRIGRPIADAAPARFSFRMLALAPLSTMSGGAAPLKATVHEAAALHRFVYALRMICCGFAWSCSARSSSLSTALPLQLTRGGIHARKTRPPAPTWHDA